MTTSITSTNNSSQISNGIHMNSSLGDVVSETESFKSTLKDLDTKNITNNEKTEKVSKESKTKDSQKVSKSQDNPDVTKAQKDDKNTSKVDKSGKEDKVSKDYSKKEKTTEGNLEKKNSLEKELQLISQKKNENSESGLFSDQNKQGIFLAGNIEMNNQFSDNQNQLALQSVSELNSRISAINALSSSKDKSFLGSMSMNLDDADFFIKMVENQTNNNVQANITLNAQTNQIMLANKAQSMQSSAAVSQALIDKLNESMNTNKSFRVDFDKDIAVVMKVDAKGTLSANFIPGSSAVEQYLRNNILELRQTFDSKGLNYNELSYTGKKHQNQNRQNRNQKGDRDE